MAKPHRLQDEEIDPVNFENSTAKFQAHTCSHHEHTILKSLAAMVTIHMNNVTHLTSLVTQWITVPTRGAIVACHNPIENGGVRKTELLTSSKDDGTGTSKNGRKKECLEEGRNDY